MTIENYEQNLPKELIEKKLNIFRAIWRAYHALPTRNLIAIVLDSRTKEEEQAFAFVHLLFKSESAEAGSYAELDVLLDEDDAEIVSDFYHNRSTILTNVQSILSFIENTQKIISNQEIQEIAQHFSTVAENWGTLFSPYERNEDEEG